MSGEIILDPDGFVIVSPAIDSGWLVAEGDSCDGCVCEPTPLCWYVCPPCPCSPLGSPAVLIGCADAQAIFDMMGSESANPFIFYNDGTAACHILTIDAQQVGDPTGYAFGAPDIDVGPHDTCEDCCVCWQKMSLCSSGAPPGFDPGDFPTEIWVHCGVFTIGKIYRVYGGGCYRATSDKLFFPIGSVTPGSLTYDPGPYDTDDFSSCSDCTTPVIPPLTHCPLSCAACGDTLTVSFGQFSVNVNDPCPGHFEDCVYTWKGAVIPVHRVGGGPTACQWEGFVSVPGGRTLHGMCSPTFPSDSVDDTTWDSQIGCVDDGSNHPQWIVQVRGGIYTKATGGMLACPTGAYNRIYPFPPNCGTWPCPPQSPQPCVTYPDTVFVS